MVVAAALEGKLVAMSGPCTMDLLLLRASVQPECPGHVLGSVSLSWQVPSPEGLHGLTPTP